MGTMTVGALRYAGETEVRNFPVVGVTVSLKQGTMTTAALFYRIKHPSRGLDRLNPVGWVAACTTGCPIVPLSQLLPMDTLSEGRLHLPVALPARGGNIGRINE